MREAFLRPLPTQLNQLQLSLSDHPSRFMPELKGHPIDQASLLHFATYTAGGLPQQFPDAVETPPQIRRYLQQWKPAAAPGTQRRYSNPSLGLFGHVTALALGSNFAEAAQRQLFPQLGLHHSYIQVPDSAMASYAWGHRDGKAVRVNPGPFDHETYGVKSTAADMIRYLQLNIDPAGLPAPLQQAVRATQVGYFKVGPMTQGLGWESYPYPVALDQLLAGNSGSMIFDPNPATALEKPATPAGPALYNKTGGTGGFSAYAAFVPAQKIGIVMLANASYPIPARIKAAHAILAQLAKTAP